MLRKVLLTMAVGLLSLAAPRTADAQAMIGYGAGVAKAGIAGAAAGAGAVGVIGKLRGTLLTELEQAAGRQPTSEAQLAGEKLGKAITAQPGAESLKTSSGVVIAGLDHRSLKNRLISSKPAAGEVAVHKVQWAESVEPEPIYVADEPAAAGEQTRASASERFEDEGRPRRESQRSGSLFSPAGNMPSGNGGGGSPSGGSGGSSRSAAAPAPEAAPQPAARQAAAPDSGGESSQRRGGSGSGAVVGGATTAVANPWPAAQAMSDPMLAPAVSQATEAGVEIGSMIEDVVSVLGDPIVAFRGLIGRGYTEKYVFTDADGRKITVYAWHGKVTSVAVSS